MKLEEILHAVKSRKLAPAEAARLISVARSQQPRRAAKSLNEVRELLVSSFAKALYMECGEVKLDQPFIDMGLDSITGVEWMKVINRSLQLELPATSVYDYPTINVFAECLTRMQGDDGSGSAANAKPEPLPKPQVRSASTGGDMALVVSGVHTLDQISLSSWRIESPGAKEITVRVKASGINFPDVMCVNGLYPTMPRYPFVPGFEVAGVVIDKGKDVTDFDIGDEIIGLTGANLGGHAPLVNLPQDNAVRKPENVSFAEACSLPVAFGIVHYAFELADLRADERVLIHTATGGCGLLAIQMARLKGARCIGTSSREHKLELLKKLNVEHAINYRGSFDEVIKDLTRGAGVDVVLNMLSGEAIQRGLNCLAPSGRYMEIAVHGLRTSPKLSLSHLLQNQSFHSIDLRSLSLTTGRGAKESLVVMMRLLEQRSIVPIVSRIYPFSKIAEALEYVGRGEHLGKVVLSHECDEVVDLTDACIQGLLQQEQRALHSRSDRSKLNLASIGDRRESGLNSQSDAPLASRFGDPIAVIGLSGQFPKCPSIRDFWRSIARGENCVSEVSSRRWSTQDFYCTDPQAQGKTNCKWQGELEDADKFDPLFFNISPNEALSMDPQQRLLLQSSWACVEDAGIDPSQLSAVSCGVFVGVAPGDYGYISDASGLNANALMGKSLSILAARVSFFLNLKGPCITLDTACSSALVAIAEACNHLSLGTCRMALAGGVNVMSGPGLHIMTSKAEMLSSDGRCYTFDQRANGFVPAEGVGVVLLKKLVDAQQDGDAVHAVIRGWGVNQDGRTNGITAPSATSQTQLETDVYQRFDIDPGTITLVEAHGTGTKLGDPIEVRALTDAFRKFTDKRDYCALGSVKSNMGHAMAAAGVAGFIKAVLALEHKQLPPTINFERLNEHVQIAGTPFYINSAQKPWSVAAGMKRRAAVSSFGFSGTNAHVVLEEGLECDRGKRGPQLPYHLIALSARNSDQLGAQVAQLLEHLPELNESELGNISYTLLNGRKHFKCRLAVIVESVAQLKALLQQWQRTGQAEGVLTSSSSENERSVGVRAENKTLQKLTDQCLTDCGEFSRNEKADFADKDIVGDYREKLGVLVASYIDGHTVDFGRFLDRRRFRPLSLPTYPFAKRQLWIGSTDSARSAAADANADSKPQTPLVVPIAPATAKVSLRPAIPADIPGAAPAGDAVTSRLKVMLSKTARAEPAIGLADEESIAIVNLGRGVFCMELRHTLTGNAVSGELVQSMRSCQRKIASDESAKVILLKGTAEHFAHGTVEGFPFALLTASTECELPTIAVTRGNCSGAGWLLASQCDLLIGGEESTQDYLTAPGRAPQEWERAYLERRFGSQLAELLLDPNRTVTGGEIKRGRFGVAIFPQSQIDAAALDLAYLLANMPRHSLVELKKHYATSSLRFIEALRSGADSAGFSQIAALHARRRVAQDSWLHLANGASAAVDGCSTRQPADPREIPLSSQLIRMIELGHGVVEIQLRDHEHKNMLSAPLVLAIAEAFDKVARSPEFSVVILTGYDKYFSLGGNKESLEAIQRGTAKFSDTLIYSVALDCEIPVIAALQGHGIGAGWAMGMYADYVLLSNESIYISPYMSYGFTPGAGATLIFPYQFGSDLGREILFTAREYTGKQLAQRYLGVPVLPRTEVVDHARQLAARLARIPRAELILAKNKLCAGLRESIEATYQQELKMHDVTFVGRSAVMEAIQARFADDNVRSDTPIRENHEQIHTGTVDRTSARPGGLPDSALTDTLEGLRSTLADQLGLEKHEIADDVGFLELGLDSVVGVTWIRKVNQAYGLAIPVTKVYQYPTLAEFASYVVQERTKEGDGAPSLAKRPTETHEDLKLPAMPTGEDPAGGAATQPLADASETHGNPHPEAADRDIAIVGMAGRFPMSRSVDEFWRNIASKADCIREVTRWSIADYYDQDRNKKHKSYSKWMGAIDGADEFDALFFNISPQEARAMDPQQRLFLMTAWECIEDAGYNPVTFANSRCGVFVGCGPNDYGFTQDKALNAEALTGASSSILAGRVSYFLNLRGPCIAIDTACSSSLVAIAQACDNLLLDNCDLALAGGVCVMAGPTIHIMTSNAGMLSPDGRCHAFDRSANGFVPGEGVGVVLLKKLKDAIAAGDHVDAVLRAWGVNQDGRTNGITAPNPESQASLEREVYRKFSIDPAQIQLIETHGTGTKLGDPIEIEGLLESFGKHSPKPNYCALGSVKSNIGHLQAAAGVASLIKVVMALKHRQLPPTINFAELNEFIELERSPFYVNTELRPWEVEAGLRRQAAISSFGFSGTNAHVVVAAHGDDQAADSPVDRQVLIVLSARSTAQLDEMTAKLLAHVTAIQAEGAGGAALLASVAYTLQAGRQEMEQRLALVVASIDELAQQLTACRDGAAEGRSRFRGAAKAVEQTAVSNELKAAQVALARAGQLGSIAEMWVRGVAVDWPAVNEVMFGARMPRRVSLPTYAFARDRYWIGELDANRSGVAPPANGPRHYSLPKNLLMARECWQSSPMPAHEDVLRARAAVKGDQRVLVLYRNPVDLEMLTKALLHFWSGLTSKLLVEPLRASGTDTPASCLDTYLATHAAPNVVFYVPGAASDLDERSFGESELQQLLLVSQSLIKRAGNGPLEFFHCYTSSTRVSNIYLEGFSGLFRAIAMECPPHRYRNLALAQLAELADYKVIVSEWLALPAAPQAPAQIAELQYQEGRRFATRFSEWNPATKELANSNVFRTGATYLMVGALGAVGLQMCLVLARAFRPRLVILSRRGDQRSEGAYPRAAIEQLEQAGAQVVFHSVDITDVEKLREVLRVVRAAVGPIHGVFHFARAVDNGLIENKKFGEFRKTIAAKVDGTLNVDLLTADEPLEFFIAFSSMAAFGIAGSADYAYATAFQNALVRDRNRKLLEGTRQGVSIAFCWGQWVVDAYSDRERDAMLQKMGFDFIDAPFALQVMAVALHELQSVLENARPADKPPGDVLGIMAVNDALQIKQLYGLGSAHDGQTDSGRAFAERMKLRSSSHDDEVSVADLITLGKELDGDEAALKTVLHGHSYSQLHTLYESLTGSR